MLSGRLWRQMESQARARRLEWPYTATTRRSTERAFRGSVTMALATKSGSSVSSKHSLMPTMTCATIPAFHVCTSHGLQDTVPKCRWCAASSQCCVEFDAAWSCNATTPKFAGHCTVRHGLISSFQHCVMFIHSLPHCVLCLQHTCFPFC